MGKYLLLVLLVLGASLYFPRTRPVVLDTLAPVIDPALTWQTKGEMTQILRELQTINREGNLLPAPGKPFQDWISKNFQGGSGKDAWGTSYTLRVWSDSVGIVSNGPDLEIDTRDDVVQTALIQRRRRSR